MTKKPAAIRFVFALAASIFGSVQRLLKRLSAPGSGPFFAGC